MFPEHSKDTPALGPLPLLFPVLRELFFVHAPASFTPLCRRSGTDGLCQRAASTQLLRVPLTLLHFPFQHFQRLTSAGF